MAACGQLGNVKLRRQLNRRNHEAEMGDEDEAAAAAAADGAAAVGAEQLQGEAAVGGEAARLCGRADLEW